MCGFAETYNKAAEARSWPQPDREGRDAGQDRRRRLELEAWDQPPAVASAVTASPLVRILNSMRRLFARPSGVSLLSIG